MLQPFLNLRRDAVAGLEHPFIKPHLQPVRPQPLRDGTNNRLVLGTVTQENVELKFIGHILLWASVPVIAELVHDIKVRLRETADERAFLRERNLGLNSSTPVSKSPLGRRR